MPTGTSEPIRGLRYFAWAMLQCAPLCALALLASSNEYRDMGIEGAVDLHSADHRSSCGGRL